MAGKNGKRKPPRPEIQIEAANASPEEAAAIAAALEQFLAETAPTAQATAPRSRWQSAGLREGISARVIEPGGWGTPGR
jgi:hypothetical protein